jgi:hypothetical protein
MAFIKFKPLTPKFNFHKVIDELPYQTYKDVALFTDK